MESNDHEGSNPDEFPLVPDNVRSLIEQVDFLDTSELPDDISQVLAPAVAGFCMTCGAQLGNETALIITKRGINAAYCGGPCMQDMAVLGYLQEAHDDIKDRVAFRGGEDVG